MKSNFKFSLTLLSFIFLYLNSYAARVDTLQVTSNCMKKVIKNTIILPEKYSKDKQYPVLYLLHGYSGNFGNWVNNPSSIKSLVDFYDFIVVCPDGGFDSWYWDIKGDEKYQYESYVSHELPEYIDSNFSTKKDRTGRAITGLSMGGHGALSLAFKHQDIYGAAGSMSGGLDIRPYPMNWNIKNRIGSYAGNPTEWESKTVINMVNLLQPGKLDLIIDCGKEDFFYKVNVAFHDKLDYNNISHTFITRTGVHNWDYWSKAIVYQMAFFNEFFNKKS